MLVLTRKIGEEILIGDDVRVVFLGMMGAKRNTIKLGVIAPRSVVVDRREVREDKEKTSAQE